jgi:hypothetical protein
MRLSLKACGQILFYCMIWIAVINFLSWFHIVQTFSSLAQPFYHLKSVLCSTHVRVNQQPRHWLTCRVQTAAEPIPACQPQAAPGGPWIGVSRPTVCGNQDTIKLRRCLTAWQQHVGCLTSRRSYRQCARCVLGYVDQSPDGSCLGQPFFRALSSCLVIFETALPPIRRNTSPIGPSTRRLNVSLTGCYA